MTRWLFLASSPDPDDDVAWLAGHLQRSGQTVAVIATDDYVTDALVRGAARRLRSEGTQVLYDENAVQRRGLLSRVTDIERCTAEQTAARVLEPGVRVVWR